MPADPLDLDWSAVSHAYGPADDLPDLLRALRSRRERRRTEAAERFRARALHQESIYEATVAAVPYLIELLADANAPDRTLGHELLAEIVPEPPTRPGPRLHRLAEQRSDQYLGRPDPVAETDPVVRRAREAVRAGVPTYLRLLDDPDRNARGLSAHLLSFFPEDAPRTIPAITARLAVEPDTAVAAFLCLAAGMIGEPSDTELVAAVTRWRDQPGRILRWTVLMGLVRLTETPDVDMLEQLCDCLFRGPEEVSGWTFHQESPALGAALALGDLTVASVPGLATMLLDGLKAGGEDMSRFMYATRLLLSLAFPDGPSTADLTPLQHTVVNVIRDSGLAEFPEVSRLLKECNLPGDADPR